MGSLHVVKDENFSDLFKDISFKISRFTMSTESQRQLIKKKTTPGYIIVKLQKTKDMEKMLGG